MGRKKRNKPIGRLVVRTNQVNKAGEAPVYIAYYVAGKTIEKTTDIMIPIDNWNATKQAVVKHKDAVRLNGKLAKIKNDFDGSIEQYDGLITPYIVRKILDGEPVDGRPNPKTTDFIQYAIDYNNRRYNVINEIGYKVWYNAYLSIKRFAKYIETIRGEASIPISEVKIETIEGYKDIRRKEVCQETIKKDIIPLINAIKYAEKKGLISPYNFGDLSDLYEKKSHSYADAVDEAEKKVRYLTEEQMRKFIDYYSEAKYDRTREYMDMFLFAFHAGGLRVSDIATLEWKHIDFDNRRLEKVLVKGKNHHEFYLSDSAIAILKAWKAKNINPRFVFGLLPEDFDFGESSDKRDGGERLYNIIASKNRAIQTSLNEIGKKIGLDFNLSMHVARHTFAIWALNYKNVPLHYVSRMLGHKSINTTEKSYAKFLKDKVDNVIKNEATFDSCLPDCLV